jgi:formylglycine-generating enzyme required for sulfatase activity
MFRRLLVLVACSGAVACAPVQHLEDRPEERLVPVEMVFVKGGCFEMGTPLGPPGGPEEKPAHEVCVSDFHIGKFEVTQAQWRAVMGNNPSTNQDCGDDCPVETVSWDDAQKFIARLNARTRGEREGTPGQYRLPTEAEWEYAARSGGKAQKYAGRSDDVGSVGWYAWNSSGIHSVGTKAPNGLGLHDMTGNVWEWTSDWYGSSYYASSPRQDPTGPATGDRRVTRGGSYGNDLFDLRTSYRNFLPPGYRGPSKGFRLAWTTKEPRA